MHLSSVTIHNFKAIRDEEIELSDYNIIIGKNDIGKSSVLEAIDLLLNFDTPSTSDFYMQDESKIITIHGEIEDVPDELTDSLSESYHDGGTLELTIKHESSGSRDPAPSQVRINGDELEDGAIVSNNGEELTAASSRDFLQAHLSDTVAVLAERDYDDQTTLKRGSYLTKLMDPVLESDTVREQKRIIQNEIEEEVENIEQDINSVLSDQHPRINDVRIDVEDVGLSRAIQSEIRVRDSNTDEWMPLSDRGSGVGNQFILSMMKAYADSQIEDYCVLFEEPENSLHPSAVREMAQALQEISQDEQVILTTHSQSLINSHANGNLIVASNSDGLAEFELLDSEAFKAIEAIGAKNSDILQSDYVVYTEGASDAAVLEVVCEHEFTDWKNRNITIQPAGGSNLEHQLENMKEINRHSGILIDSDRNSEDGELGDQAEILKRKAEDAGVEYWVLDRAEIESYFAPEAIEEVLGTTGVTFDPYGDVEDYLNDEHGYKEGWKVANAREITTEMYEMGLDEEFEEIKQYLQTIADRAES